MHIICTECNQEVIFFFRSYYPLRLGNQVRKSESQFCSSLSLIVALLDSGTEMVIDFSPIILKKMAFSTFAIILNWVAIKFCIEREIFQ